MNSRAVATANAVRSINPTKDSSAVPWGDMWHQAAALVNSGFLPSAIKTPEQAIAVILTGEELGLPKMLALRSIHIVQGRPTLSADLMASLVLREIDRHKDGLLMVQPPTAEACTVRFRRWGWTEEQSYTYTIADAQRAGLAGKDTWKQHPAAMVRARATAAVCRMAFPDVVAGLYAVGGIADEGDWGEADAIAGDSAFDPPSTPPQPRIDAVEAQVRGLPVPETDGDIIDADTGEITDEVRIHPEQMREIVGLKRGLGWDAQTIRTFSADRVGKADSGALSADEADYLIEQLRLEQDRQLMPAGVEG